MLSPGSRGLQHPNAVGHIAEADSSTGPKTVWVVLIGHEDLAYQMVLEFPSDMAERLAPEAESILASLRFRSAN
jgi:hypothetical protein